MAGQEKLTTIADRLHRKLLERWEKLIDDDNMTGTDAATLVRFLETNGYALEDPGEASLKDKVPDLPGSPVDAPTAEELGWEK